MDLESVSFACFHSSQVQRKRNGAAAWIRNVAPADSERICRLNFQISSGVPFRRFRDRSATSAMRSKTWPSEAERTSLMYSACAQQRGMAPPVGRPKYICDWG
jgi:hypothetical protein